MNNAELSEDVAKGYAGIYEKEFSVLGWSDRLFQQFVKFSFVTVNTVVDTDVMGKLSKLWSYSKAD